MIWFYMWWLGLIHKPPTFIPLCFTMRVGGKHGLGSQMDSKKNMIPRIGQFSTACPDSVHSQFQTGLNPAELLPGLQGLHECQRKYQKKSQWISKSYGMLCLTTNQKDASKDVYLKKVSRCSMKEIQTCCLTYIFDMSNVFCCLSIGSIGGLYGKSMFFLHVQR